MNRVVTEPQGWDWRQGLPDLETHVRPLPSAVHYAGVARQALCSAVLCTHCLLSLLEQLITERRWESCDTHKETGAQRGEIAAEAGCQGSDVERDHSFVRPGLSFMWVAKAKCESRCLALSKATWCSSLGRNKADTNPTSGTSHAPSLDGRGPRGRLGEVRLTSLGSDQDPGFAFLVPAQQSPLGEEKGSECGSQATIPLSA